MALAATATLAVLVVAVGVAIAGFLGSSRTVVIGAHTTTVRPSVDGHATLDFGPLLPRIRIPVDEPFGLGVRIDVGDTSATSLDELVRRDALIASSPAGEVRAVRSELIDMAVDNAVRGIGAGGLAGLLLVGAWRLVGPRRRADVAATTRRL